MIVRDSDFDDYLDQTYAPTQVSVLDRRERASDLLFGLDPTLYEDRRDHWLEQKLAVALGRNTIPRAHAEKNRERFENLVPLVAKQRVVPFVGAGVSAACGLPTWAGYLKKLARECGYPAKTLSRRLSQGKGSRRNKGNYAPRGRSPIPAPRCPCLH